MAWYIKYEFIHRYEPSAMVPADFLKWRNSELVPLYFLEAVPGANKSLRFHQKFCSKAS